MDRQARACPVPAPGKDRGCPCEFLRSPGLTIASKARFASCIARWTWSRTKSSMSSKRLSSNIVAAKHEFVDLVSEIQKCALENVNERRSPSVRSRTETIFSSCSAARSISTESGSTRRPSRVQRELFDLPNPTEQDEPTKQGWLWKTPLTSIEKPLRRTWTKRWFVLKGFSLSYYRVKENSSSPEAGIEGKEPRRSFDLSSTITVIRKPRLDDLAKKLHDARKFVPQKGGEIDGNPTNFLAHLIFVQTQQGKLCLRAEDSEDSAIWLSLFSRRLMQASYIERTKHSHAQLDKAVLKLLENPASEHWDFKDCVDTESLIIGLLDLLPHCSSVRRLSLARCKLGDKEMTKLQGHLATIFLADTLEVLDLSENMIRSKGVLGLGLAICESSSLRELILDHNQLSDRGLEILARNIWGSGRPIAAALQKFSVIDDGITDKGVQTLADILVKAQSPIGLRYLLIGENKICDQGAAILKISKALPSITVDLQSTLCTLGKIGMVSSKSMPQDISTRGKFSHCLSAI